MPYAISSGTSSDAASTSVSGAISNVRCDPCRLLGCGERQRVRGRVDRPARLTGRPIPKPGIAALPHAAAGSSASSPVAWAAAMSAAISGSSSGASDSVPASAPAGSGRSEKGRARPTIVTASPGSSRVSR